MLVEIGIGLIVGSVGSLISSLKFHSSFDLSKSFLSACKTLGLTVTYGEEIALPSVNKTVPFEWGTRLIVGLPVGLSSQKVIDQRVPLAEALRVDPDNVEMRYANDGLIVDVITAKMPTMLAYSVGATSPHPYRIMIGVNRRGEPRYYDFDGPFPHLLIGGISGGGKSVMLRSILTTLATGPAPDMYLCDLKGGVELGIFRDLACVAGFASTLPDVRTAATAVESEMLRRYAVMAANGTQQWAGKKTLFVVDELADFKTRAGDPDAKLKNEIKAVLTRLSAKGRAAGVLLVLATQRPSADVVDGLIKTNIAASVCFRTRDGVQSRIVIDSPDAASLPDIPGRLIFQTAYDETLQAPYLSADDAKKLIAELPKKSKDDFRNPEVPIKITDVEENVCTFKQKEEPRHVDANPHTSEVNPLDGNSIEL
ncbi:FtsK/SpoIIIE domain-containing protein [Paenibacillus thailandensis]|uniref:FtsK/SpoIIIE domain-containing protein n=1 Tax=Paenibacillus thailandensis TaxID=393250 RepID=A0ABW5R2E6_9BACL